MDHITENIKPKVKDCLNDIPRWMPSVDGLLTTKSANEI